MCLGTMVFGKGGGRGKRKECYCDNECFHKNQKTKPHASLPSRPMIVLAVPPCMAPVAPAHSADPRE